VLYCGGKSGFGKVYKGIVPGVKFLPFSPFFVDCSAMATREISLSELILSYCLVCFHHLFG
jgi:hypothetical protein